MWQIVDLMTGEVEEDGFTTYASACRYFEANGFDYEGYGIESVGKVYDDPWME